MDINILEFKADLMAFVSSGLSDLFLKIVGLVAAFIWETTWKLIYMTMGFMSEEFKGI